MKTLAALAAVACISQLGYADTIFPPESSVKNLIWRGFELSSRSLLLPCVSTELVAQPIETMSLDYIYDATLEDILRESSGKMSGSFNAVVMGGSLSREFLIRKARHKNSVNAIWLIEYQKAWVSGSSPAMNLLGSATAKRPLDQRKSVCGDHFVSKVMTGTKVYLTASLLFTSEESYKKFKTKKSASALGGLVKKSKTTIKELTEFYEDAVFAIDAMQIGGSYSKLDEINASYESLCRLDSIDDCADKFAKIFDYARSGDIYASNGYRDLGDHPILFALTNTYADYGIDGLETYTVSPQFDFFDRDEKVKTLREWLSQLLWSKDSLTAELMISPSPSRKSELERAILNVQSDLDVIRGRLRACETREVVGTDC